MISTLGTLLFLASLALSNPIKSTKSCKDYTLTIDTTSTNFIWGLPELQTNYDATAFSTDIGRWDSSKSLKPISGVAEVNGSYSISGTFCSPTSGGGETVLLASHGLGFDREYWDPAIQSEKYSFVDFALAKGYSVFFYDRLGVSKSSVVSGYVIQVSIQVEIIAQLVSQIRSGTFGPPPKSVVLVGHSFGSVISNSILRLYPNLVDAAVLTGIAYTVPTNASVSLEAFQMKLARLQSPGRWRQLDGGYVTWADVFANINTFFKAPFYDTNVIEYAEANKQPFALMELITISITNLTSPDYAGPVLVITGEYDFIFCTGFCPGVLEPAATEAFPASKGLEVYIQPDSGHAINLSLNATGAFGVITDFLEKNGF